MAEPHYTDQLPVRRKQPGNVVIKWLTTTDHKTIGTLYLVTSFAFFCIGGVMALFMRAELARPGLQFMSNEQFNQAFTMHGTIMLLMFATPLFAGFTNLIMPLQIGAPDVAFPRLNMFAYWLYLFGSTIAVGGFLTPQGAADFGWFAYSPLSDAVRSPGIGADLWIMGLAFSGFGTILGAVNFITTIICMRAPGMTMFRMPIFVWNVLLTAVLVLLAFPVLAAALFALEADRKFGVNVHSANGGALLATPLLVLRPSRGVHHRAAVLRDHLRGHPGLLPQADVRLQSRSGTRRSAPSSERALKVDSTPVVQGAWHWVDDKELHYRPREYWPAHAVLQVRSNLEGIKISDRLWGGKAKPLKLTTGDSVIAVTDAASHDWRPCTRTTRS
ncbi:hypothetical protein SALBM311S_07258 [Streptomyces alboniger]